MGNSGEKLSEMSERLGWIRNLFKSEPGKHVIVIVLGGKTFIQH
jgi:hypothetical protein